MRLLAPLVLALAIVPPSCARNSPPDIAPVAPLEVTVGNRVDVALVASDPDGDEVTFTVAGAPAGAAVEGDPGAQHFVYAPLASDAGPGGRVYDLAFVASDGRGGEATAATTLTVLPEYGAPAFEGPFAWTLDLASDRHVVAVIRVRDDDTAALTFRLIGGMDGARFVVVDGHTAALWWRPTPAQVASGTIAFPFQVGASDGTHPEVPGDFAVVLSNAGLFAACPGTPPRARFEPPPDFEGPGDVPLRVRAADAESVVREVTVECSAAVPAVPGQVTTVALQPDPADPGAFAGALPAPKAAGMVFCHAFVTDDDDPAFDTCDHRVRVPADGEVGFHASPIAGGACADDGLCGPCDTTAPATLPMGTTTGLRLCGGPDAFRVHLEAGRSLAAVATSMADPDVPLKLMLWDAGGTAVGKGPWLLAKAPMTGDYLLEVEPPDGTAGAVTYRLETAVLDPACDYLPSSAPAADGGAFTDLLCSPGYAQYLVSPEAGQAARLSVRFAPATPVFLDVTDPAGNPAGFVAGFGDERHVVIESVAARTTYSVQVRSAAFGAVPFDWSDEFADLADLCTDDRFAPNASLEAAPVVPEGTWDNLRLCPGKADVFRLGLNGGEALTATVAMTDGGTVPPLAILDADGQVLATAAGTSVSATAATAGDRFVRVGPATAGAPHYSLTLATTTLHAACPADRLEPDDTPGAAATAPPGFTTHLTLCPAGDRDVFAFRMAPWEALTVRTRDGTAKTRLVVVDADGKPVASDVAVPGGREVFFLSPRSDTFDVIVDPDGAGGWYDLAVERD